MISTFLRGCLQDDHPVWKADCGCDWTWLKCIEESHGTINLNYTGIINLPVDRLCRKHASNVRKIYSKRNLIENLPENMHDHYGNVTELYFPSNRVTSLPDDIALLKSLENLNVEDNCIRCFPDGMTSMIRLKCIVARGNRLEKLPREIGKMTNLELLDVASNAIRHIPTSIGGCTSLIKLWVSHNRLTSLPRHLCTMTSLKEICASSNNILCLPIDLGCSRTFEMLQISENKLLHAIPHHVTTKLLNFHCSSHVLLNRDIASHFGIELLPIHTSSNDDVYVLQPIGVRGIGVDVPSLKDLAMHVLHGSLLKEENLAIIFEDLPPVICDHLLAPEGHCYFCNNPMFYQVYAKYIRTVDFNGSKLYTIAYFCSVLCSNNYHL